MSEAWHQHLAHLSWWEEIDRWFFPSHYSCTSYGSGNAWEVFWLFIFNAMIVFLAVGVFLFLRHFFIKKKEKVVVEELTTFYVWCVKGTPRKRVLSDKLYFSERGLKLANTPLKSEIKVFVGGQKK